MSRTRIVFATSMLLILWFGLAANALAETTITLQEGLNGYVGTTDNDTWDSQPTVNRGARTDWRIGYDNRNMGLVRFAIFASEGGPVPDGATITSATLSVYKASGPDAVIQAKRLLRGWSELESAWSLATSSASWQTAGAQGAADVAASADGQGSIGAAAGWLDIDVTAGVQSFASGTINHGWRVSHLSGSTGIKVFVSRNNTASPGLHPRLRLTFDSPQATVTLQEGLEGYRGTADNDTWDSQPTVNRGARADWRIGYDDRNMGLMRFAIFANEGGPVPTGATITRATLSVYKTSGPEAVIQAKRLLRSWSELESAWSLAAAGTPWQVAGAQGAADVGSTDGQGSIGPAAGWLTMDLTAAVQAFASGTANHGWRVDFVSGITGIKEFVSRNNTVTPLLRPKLTIAYTVDTPAPVTLQDGLAGYAGTADNDTWSSQPTVNRGHYTDWRIGYNNTNMGLIRFAIFQSEGGPVPDGATITGATLSVYKTNGPDAVIQAKRLLRSWNELESAWSLAATGVPWQTAGAQGAEDVGGVDGQGSIGAAAGWLDIDVTAAVQVFAGGTANHGWRVSYVSGSTGIKEFVSRNNTASPSLRPKLTIAFDGEVIKPPTADLVADPASGVAPLSVSFSAAASSDSVTDLRLEFGDGHEVSWLNKNQSQAHSYPQPGTYTAMLTVRDADGRSSNATHRIVVRAANGPTAELAVTPVSAIVGQSVAFSAAGSTAGSAPIANLALRFGDDDEVSWFDKNEQKSHTYSTPGTYTAELTVTDSSGLSSQDSVTVVISDEDTGGGGTPHFTHSFEQIQAVEESSGFWRLYVDQGVADHGLALYRPQLQAKDPGDHGVGLVNFGRLGSKALRLWTNGSDTSVSGSGSNERIELNYLTPMASMAEGVEEWWAHSVFLPNDFAFPGTGTGSAYHWHNINQFHQSCGPGGQPKLTLQFAANHSGRTVPTFLIFFNTAVRTTSPVSPTSAVFTHRFWQDQIDVVSRKNVWWDFVHHVKYSSNPANGEWKIWLRFSDETGPAKLIFHWRGETRYPGCGGTFKIGQYKSHLQPSAIIFDRVLRGSQPGDVSMFPLEGVDF